MEAVHQCSAQGLQFTPGEHSPEHQEEAARRRRYQQHTCKTSSHSKVQFNKKNPKILFVLVYP